MPFPISLSPAFFAASSAVVLAHNPQDEAAARSRGTARATAAIVY